MEKTTIKNFKCKECDIMLICDSTGMIKNVSKEKSGFLGYSDEDLIGWDFFDFIPENDKKLIQDILLENIQVFQDKWIQIEVKNKNGKWIPYSLLISEKDAELSSKEIHFVLRGIEKKKRQDDIQIFHEEIDDLTGLFNRKAFIKELTKSFMTREFKGFTVLKFNLDRFRNINDLLGYDAGDEYIKEFTRRVKKALRPNDFFARVGGDEFAAILYGQMLDSDISNVMNRVKTQIETPFEYGLDMIYIKSSIGAAKSFAKDERIEDILLRADSALNAAKELGGATNILYTEAIDPIKKKDFLIEREILEAIKHNRVRVFYQPICNTETRETHHAEALVRVEKEDGTFMSPAEFIPIVENTNLIHILGTNVLYQACNHIRYLSSIGIDMSVGINVSPKQLMQDDFASVVQQIIFDTDVSPESVVLEITESSMMNNIKKVQDVITELKGIGVKLALDDFGTGHSSLSMLTMLPFDYLKIDKSFIDDIMSPKSFAEQIVNIGKTLNMKIVAEGVESEEQRVRLFLMNCDYVQGYLFYKPMPEDAHTRLMKEQKMINFEDA